MVGAVRHLHAPVEAGARDRQVGQAALDETEDLVAAGFGPDEVGPLLVEALKLWEQANDLSTIAVRQSLDAQATAFEMGGIIAGLAAKG